VAPSKRISVELSSGNMSQSSRSWALQGGLSFSGFGFYEVKSETNTNIFEHFPNAFMIYFRYFSNIFYAYILLSLNPKGVMILEIIF